MRLDAEATLDIIFHTFGSGTPEKGSSLWLIDCPGLLQYLPLLEGTTANGQGAIGKWGAVALTESICCFCLEARLDWTVLTFNARHMCERLPHLPLCTVAQE